MAERKFGDLRLTEEEVRAIVLERGRFIPSLPKREKRRAKAMRLLPLWRDWAIEELHHSTIVKRLEKLQAQVLEATNIAHENAELRKRVAELEAQLAWTPVSEGLPMEEGVTYEFLRWDRDHVRMFTRDTSVTVDWPWEPVDKDDPLACDDEMVLEFTHWRKVMLP